MEKGVQRISRSMDPHTQGAYGQIRLFLADLNLVLGSMPKIALCNLPPGLQPFPAGCLTGIQTYFNQVELLSWYDLDG
ncbi:hypothetical protein VP01_940g5 [Puccinia sorghi]|uniref:Uncharacterized protein n=1 Tax=Puccinia sorghi TaxID=27349 RepID=A0A0L6U8U1_9BASI|nr:hypothetical protein VP01_940g5 [Puccinia sorghi]